VIPVDWVWRLEETGVQPRFQLAEFQIASPHMANQHGRTSWLYRLDERFVIGDFRIP
jgi:hypothetical protein